MLEITDIIIEPNDDESYLFNHGYVNKPLKIFGQMRFNADDDADDRLGLTLPKNVNLAETLDGLNAYLNWLADCKDELVSFYKDEFAGDIDEYFDGEMTPDWFETLEIYSGTVFLEENGAFGADFSTGDNMDEDHLLIIEMEGREITGMWHDG